MLFFFNYSQQVSALSPVASSNKSCLRETALLRRDLFPWSSSPFSLKLLLLIFSFQPFAFGHCQTLQRPESWIISQFLPSSSSSKKPFPVLSVTFNQHFQICNFHFNINPFLIHKISFNWKKTCYKYYQLQIPKFCLLCKNETLHF